MAGNPYKFIGGCLVGCVCLASFNYLLALFPDELRARDFALYQLVVTLALAGGAAVGSLVITQIGYQGVFLLSAIGRVIASLVFARFVRPVKQNHLPSISAEIA